MLTRLGLRNFKAFGDEMQYADLAPITLIYGPNSGGKSSIIQALRMLKQSHEASRGRPLTLVTNGNLVNLGSYSSLIHNHGIARRLGVEIDYDFRGMSTLPTTIWDDVSTVLRGRQSNATLSASNSISMEFKHTRDLVELGYDFTSSIGAQYKIKFPTEQGEDGSRWQSLDSDSRKSLLAFIKSMRNFEEDRRRDERLAEDEGRARTPYAPTHNATHTPWLSGFHDKVENIKSESDLSDTAVDRARHGIPTAIRIGRQVRGTLQELGKLSERRLRLELDEIDLYKNHLDRLVYLGPIMSHPQRYYDIKEQSRRGRTVGVGGENVPQILKDNPALNERIDAWLERFHVDYTVSAASVDSDSVIGNELVAIKLKHRNSDATVTLADVGFGINQILPVILQGTLGERQIICVEQPEIHLHPALQAELTEFLIETSSADKANKDRGVGNQWIVETHSEMIIRRLQTRIREGQINYKDVSVLYVDPQDDGSSAIKQLRLNESGYWLDDWPAGFFDESADEARRFRRARKVRN